LYAIAAKSFRVSTWLAVYQRVYTSPPITFDDFDPSVLEGHSLIYLCLHGLSGQDYLYGDEYATALSGDQIRSANLGGAIVYNAGCWGIGPISDALLAAGASTVIADSDANWAGWNWRGPTGANAFGKFFLRGLHKGWSTGGAFQYAYDSYSEQARSSYDAELLRTMCILGDTSIALGGT